jgi:hypothetical protein
LAEDRLSSSQQGAPDGSLPFRRQFFRRIRALESGVDAKAALASKLAERARCLKPGVLVMLHSGPVDRNATDDALSMRYVYV